MQKSNDGRQKLANSAKKLEGIKNLPPKGFSENGNSMEKNVWEVSHVCIPTLTNVTTRKGMAIIKIDQQAVILLRQYHQTINDSKSKGYLTWATTEPFTLELFWSDHVIKIDVTFKLFLDTCFEGKTGKFVSVFMEISPHEKFEGGVQLLVTVFLKESGFPGPDTFKKRFTVKEKRQFPVTTGLKQFMDVESFNRMLMKGSKQLMFGLNIIYM